MGHRMLIAYERGADYDVHRSHWGVDPDDLTPATPFGGAPDDDWARERTADLLDPEGGELVDDSETAVDPDPIARGVGFDAVLEWLDPLAHEALYVVDDDWNVRTYLPFPIDRGAGSLGALVRYERAADAAYLRGWVAGARAVRDASGADSLAVVRALRWLDPDRGTVVWIGGERGA